MDSLSAIFEMLQRSVFSLKGIHKSAQGCGEAATLGLEFGHFLKGGADNLVCPFGFHKEAKSVAPEMNVS